MGYAVFGRRRYYPTLSFGFDLQADKALTNSMSNLSQLTPVQLRKAAGLKEKIAALQKQLDSLLGATASKPAAAAAPKAKRKLSPAARARIVAAQKARWAKIRAAKKS